MTTVIRNQGTSLAVREKLAAEGKPRVVGVFVRQGLYRRVARHAGHGHRGYPRVPLLCARLEVH